MRVLNASSLRWLFAAALLQVSCGGDIGEVDLDPDARVDTAMADAGDTATPDTERDATDTGDAARLGGPPYPIVLVHGMFGFEHLADQESAPYWFEIPAALEEAGEDEVYVTEVDPLNDSYDRGEALLEQIDVIVKESEHRKVNLIAHSQGGLDARYVAHHRPEAIASVFTIASPHEGTEVADVVLELTDNEYFRDLVDAVVRLFGSPLYDEAGRETSLYDALENMSEEGMETFNDQITDQPGVVYASMTGRSGEHEGGEVCDVDAPEFITKWDDQLDPVDDLLSVSELALSSIDDGPNDGLVVARGARWGEFLGCIPADHLDQVGHLLGDHPGGENTFDHLEFYLDLADYLRELGL